MNDKKVVSIEDRIPKLKQARKKKANRRLIFYLSIFFFLIAIIVYLQSPLSHINAVHVNGNAIVSKEELIELSDLKNTTNIWTIDKDEISANIKSNPMIDSVTIKRKLPQDIEITVNEFSLVGFLKKDDDFLPVVEEGVVIKDREMSNAMGAAPLLIDFTEDDYLKRMAFELNELPQSILNMISEVHWQPTEDNENKIMLYMNDGYIVSSTIRGFSDKMAVYPSIVSQLETGKKGIIHIGSGAYFESFDNEEED